MKKLETYQKIIKVYEINTENVKKIWGYYEPRWNIMNQ